MFRRITCFGVFLAAVLNMAFAQPNAKVIPIKPNEKVQSFLHAMSSTNLLEQQKLFPAGTTEEEFKKKLTELKEMAGGVQEFVVQLLYFRVHAKTTKEAMMPIVVIQRLEISQDDQVAGVLPYLETDNKSVLKESYEWLEGIDYNRKTRKYEFNRHEDTIREKKSDVPAGLVKYMYTKSPDSALSAMANVYLKKDEAKALMNEARDKDEAKALDLLSKRSEWWVHFYVAEKMRKNPKSRSSVVLDRLKKSKHPLVQKAIKEIEKADKK